MCPMLPPLPLLMIHPGKVIRHNLWYGNRHPLSHVSALSLSARVPAVCLFSLSMEKRTEQTPLFGIFDYKAPREWPVFLGITFSDSKNGGSKSVEAEPETRKPFMITEKSFSVPNQKVINSNCSPHGPLRYLRRSLSVSNSFQLRSSPRTALSDLKNVPS